MHAKYYALLLMIATFIPTSCFITMNPQPPFVLDTKLEKRQRIKLDAQLIGGVEVDASNLKDNGQDSQKKSEIKKIFNAGTFAFMPADSNIRKLSPGGSSSDQQGGSDESNEGGGGDQTRRIVTVSLASMQRDRDRADRGNRGRGGPVGTGRGHETRSATNRGSGASGGSGGSGGSTRDSSHVRGRGRGATTLPRPKHKSHK